LEVEENRSFQKTVGFLMFAECNSATVKIQRIFTCPKIEDFEGFSEPKYEIFGG
jgi:hypothetical protein